MPGGDRTGPMGAGPMTGRGAGYCAGYGMPGYMNPVGGRGWGYGGGYGFRGGFGRGMAFGGRGRGWRYQYYATGQPGWVRAGWGFPWGAPQPPVETADPETELQYLKQQAKGLGNSLKQITKRIEELEAAKSSAAEEA